MLRVTSAIVAVGLIAAGCTSEGGDATGGREVSAVDECDWPMRGQSPARTFSYPCETAISTQTVADLTQQWFFGADDVVTTSPVIVGDNVYVGDWSGRFYALDLETGEPIWTFDAAFHPSVYVGQIIGSPAVYDLADGDQLVAFGGGKTVYALDTRNGDERWSFELNPDGGEGDPTEIESAPVVADGMVVVGYDGHDALGVRAGVIALDAATGELLWDFDPDLGAEPTGCVGVWSSPSIDLERRLVYAASANCPTSPAGWGDYTEAVFALDLDTGEPRWSFQPHEPNNDDLDFAGAPNLYSVDGRDLVGLGNKDAAYYALDRDSGELVWETQATGPGLERPGSNFSTGGFIGATAVGDGLIVGGTGVGPCPCLHGLDAADGEIVWQQPLAAATYADAAIANGVLFIGGTDFTFRALDASNGDVLWSKEMTGAVSGGAAIRGDRVVAVAGLREPGTDAPSETSGVTMFSPAPSGARTTDTTEPEASQAGGVEVRLEVATGEACIGSPCAMTFGLGDPPPGTSPTAELLITPDPFSLEVTVTDLGDPADWVRPGSAASQVGATVFGVVISESDDDPQGGGVLCTFGPGEPGCRTDVLPVLRDSFNRVSILAMVDAETIPTVVDGADRLVRTISFDPPLVPVPIR